MSEEQFSDCEWFDKDEEELLQDLENKLKTDNSPNKEEEYIQSSTGAIESYLQEQRVAAASKSLLASKLPRIKTAELRRLSKSEPLEAFIFIYTNTPANFFEGQVLPNDSDDRVILYLRIYALVCELAVPCFHNEILFKFTQNEEFLDKLQVISTKLLTKRSKKVDDNFSNETCIFEDIRTLFMQTYNEGLINEKCKSVLQHINKLLDCRDIKSEVKELPVCRKLTKEILLILNESKQHETPIYHEILPTLVELLQEHVAPEPLSSVQKHDVSEYIEQQKYMLRAEFLSLMRKHVQELQKNINNFPDLLVLENVQIKSDQIFEDAQRHEQLFVYLLGQKTKISKELCSKMHVLKTGTLLCFTSSLNFEDLIYAVYHSTNKEAFQEGFIGIQIVRQFNIGNIYDKQLFMFEAPVFYESYKQTYDNLKCFTQDDVVPFQQYLVNSEQQVKAPVYLRPNVKYSYENRYFSLKKENMPREILELNELQLQSYENALTQELCLIQGPPGTGKTHLSVKLVRTLMGNAPNTPIVLLTYKNDSLDKFLLKLLDHTENVLRLGRQTRVPSLLAFTEQEQTSDIVFMPGLKQLHYLISTELNGRLHELIELQRHDQSANMLENIVAAQHKLNVVAEKLNCVHNIFSYCYAYKKGLIAMTTTCAANKKFLFKLLKSSIVIFEEAAEVKESHVIACLTPYMQHIVMIGDHQQLQPLNTSHEHELCWKLNISLFERLINQGMPYVQLEEQYRMRASIAELLTPLIYKNLHNAKSVLEYEEVREMGASLFFLNHQHFETKNNDDNSICNDYEVDELFRLIEYLINEAKYCSNDIVILSPYAKQVKMLQTKLMENVAYESIRVATVDSFQGSEANIVLLSLVRSNKNKSIGFLNDRHHICVALSRARLGLYIIGNLDLLASVSVIWKSIMEKLISKNAVGTEFPYKIQNVQN